MKLVVGLGNPGRRYVRTRHNLGFMTADVLARRALQASGGPSAAASWSSGFQGLYLQVRIDEQPVLLLKPETFMNRSGYAVRAAAEYYRLSSEQLLVISDDLALPAGKIRLRGGGSAGGHNGLESVAEQLGTDQYARLRIGIDEAPPRIAAADYVLMAIEREQEPVFQAAIERAAEAAECWLEQGCDEAMNRFN